MVIFYSLILSTLTGHNNIHAQATTNKQIKSTLRTPTTFLIYKKSYYFLVKTFFNVKFNKLMHKILNKPR